MISIDKYNSAKAPRLRIPPRNIFDIKIIKDFIEAQIALQHGRFFFWSPVFLGLGIAIYFLLPVNPPIFLGVIALLFAAASMILIPQDQRGMRLCCLAVLMLPAIGFNASLYQDARIHTPMLNRDIGPVTLTGTVQSLEIMKADYDARVILGNLAVEDLSAEETPRYVRLRLRKDYGINVGDRITALAELMPLSGPVAPGGFDFRRHLYFQGIGAVGFIYSRVEILEEQTGWSFARQVESLRAKVTESVHMHLSGAKANIATALMNGQRAGISDEDQEILRHAGLAHLLAISGLHLGLVCGAIFFFARLSLAAIPEVALHYPIKKYCAVLAMLGGVVYMFLAGATVPTQRAMLMSAVVFCAIIFDRSPFSLRLVAFAALIVLAVAPHSLLSASFQLSFAAVTALVAFYDKIRPLLSRFHRNATWPKKIAFYFIGVCMTSLIASFATAPFSLFHFQQFAALGILANMFAIPIMAFWIMPLIIVSLITMPLGLEGTTLTLIGLGIDQILQVSDFVANMEGAVWRIPVFSFWIFVPLTMGLIFFILWHGKLRLLGLGLCLLMLPFIALQPQPSILVSAEQSLVALKDNEGTIRINNLRSDAFVRENWEQLWGVEDGQAQLWPKEWPEECDDRGCRVISEGVRIAYSLKPYGHGEDCDWADLLIAKDPVRISCSAQVIDKFDTYYNGAHSVYLKPELVIKTVKGEDRKSRAWSVLYPESKY